MYATNWQSPGVFACTPALLVASSEGRITDWQSAPSVKLTTQLLQGTADEIFKLSQGNLEALKAIKISQFFFFAYLL